MIILNLKHYQTNFNDILINVMNHKAQFTNETNLDPTKEKTY